jgi:hypothetical protein
MSACFHRLRWSFATQTKTLYLTILTLLFSPLFSRLFSPLRVSLVTCPLVRDRINHNHLLDGSKELKQ